MLRRFSNGVWTNTPIPSRTLSPSRSATAKEARRARDDRDVGRMRLPDKMTMRVGSWWSTWPRTFRLRLALRYAARRVHRRLRTPRSFIWARCAEPFGMRALPAHPTNTQIAGAQEHCQATAPAAVGRCAVAYLKGTGALVASQRDHTLHSLLVFSLIGLGAVTLLSGLIGWLMAARVLSPIRTITSAARRASELHLGERVPLVAHQMSSRISPIPSTPCSTGSMMHFPANAPSLPMHHMNFERRSRRCERRST